MECLKLTWWLSVISCRFCSTTTTQEHSCSVVIIFNSVNQGCHQLVKFDKNLNQNTD